MDWLKNLPLAVALLLVGAALILLGLAGGFSAGQTSVELHWVLARILSVVLGVTMAAGAIWMETQNA